MKRTITFKAYNAYRVRNIMCTAHSILIYTVVLVYEVRS